MDLKVISQEINDLLSQRREKLGLYFIEEDHKYFMKDLKGKLRNDFPSVSTVLKKFYTPFDALSKSLEMCSGNQHEATLLREKWSLSGDYATNMGSRVHFVLEQELVDRHGSYKEVRKPIFVVDEEQTRKGDDMIRAGNNFLDLMESRGAVLVDTEIVLGDNEFGYTGQPDKVWLMTNKEKTDFGFVITDWKTNQPKNFEVQPYTVAMLPPFQDYPDTALSHYYAQLPLYGKLILKMLKGTKYENVKLMGGVVVLLKDGGEFLEYRIPSYFVNTIINMDIKKYLK